MEFRDLKKQYDVLKKEIDSNIADVVASGNYINGKQVGELEERLADYVGVKHCITCANGTDALQLALMAWNVGAGDTVFVPDFTFFSSGEVVSAVGATPMFVDVEWDTCNINPESLEKMIKRVLEKGEKPKAIIAVDLFGQPANYAELRRIAKDYGLLLLEDGAQGFGGSIDGKKACSFGDISTTSFFPAKPFGCYGDGGAIFTDNDVWADLIRSLKVHGKGRDKYDNIRIGMNSRLDTIQAGVLLAKLDQFACFEMKQMQTLAKIYTEQLQNIVETPFIRDGFVSSWAQYTIRFKNKNTRDNLQITLKENGIPSMVYYQKPMHKQRAFCNVHNLYVDEEYAITQKLCDSVLSLPFDPYKEIEEIDWVCNTIKRIMGK